MAIITVGPSGADFTTIQAAIDAANPLGGDIIQVAAGIYDEDLNIHTSVTIEGAHAGDAGTDATRDAASSVGETTIIGNSEITASGIVTINGVRFLNDGSTTGTPILAVASGFNHIIINSIFYSEVNGAADGVDDRAIFFSTLATGAVVISDNYFTGAFDGAFSDASWGRGIWFNGGGISVSIVGNTFEFTRSGINLDMNGVSAAAVVGNTFITNGTGTTVAINFDNVTFADNNYEDTRDEFNFSNLTTDVTFDAEAAVAAVAPINVVVDPVVVVGGTGSDTFFGTAGADILDGNGSGPTLALDNDILNGQGGNDVLLGRTGDDALEGGANDIPSTEVPASIRPYSAARDHNTALICWSRGEFWSPIRAQARRTASTRFATSRTSYFPM